MSRLDDISAENLRDREDFFRKQKEEAARKVGASPIQNEFQATGQVEVRDYSSSSLRDKIMHDINRKRHGAIMTVEQCNDLENDLNDETVKRVLRVLSIG